MGTTRAVLAGLGGMAAGAGVKFALKTTCQAVESGIQYVASAFMTPNPESQAEGFCKTDFSNSVDNLSLIKWGAFAALSLFALKTAYDNRIPAKQPTLNHKKRM